MGTLRDSERLVPGKRGSRMPTESENAAALDFGRVVEIVGIVGIVVSLVFLGYELKRANDIAETEAVATIYGMTNEMGLAMAEDPELSRVFRQALSDFDSLSPEDRGADPLQ